MNNTVRTQDFTITPKLYRSIISRSTLQQTQGFIWFVIAIPIIIGVWSQGNIPIILSWWPFILFMGIWFLVSIYGFPYWLSLSKANPICPYAGHVIFESESIRSIRQDGSIIERGWQEFHRITIEREAFVFWDKRRVFMIIPFMAFLSPSDQETIRAKIEQEKHISQFS